MKLWKKNIIIIVIIAIIAIIPLVICKNAEFGGADGMAKDLITVINPGYEPWAESLYEPKSGEIESMLFSLQAAIGGAILGFGFGRLSAKQGKE
ncbi:MAG: energy-coupling factor ABC transporter substrate-binding protein [Clostridium sp.]